MYLSLSLGGFVCCSVRRRCIRCIFCCISRFDCLRVMVGVMFVCFCVFVLLFICVCGMFLCASFGVSFFKNVRTLSDCLICCLCACLYAMIPYSNACIPTLPVCMLLLLVVYVYCHLGFTCANVGGMYVIIVA